MIWECLTWRKQGHERIFSNVEKTKNKDLNNKTQVSFKQLTTLANSNSLTLQSIARVQAEPIQVQ